MIRRSMDSLPLTEKEE